jgi:hypothetical protein
LERCRQWSQVSSDCRLVESSRLGLSDPIEATKRRGK